mmetsp:Transcript_9562/g.14346  ORF Transcript_9562/g.14346 Transcript_9562/m.14346 type:complete len:101 (+) Transcript_9562:45-347(+)
MEGSVQHNTAEKAFEFLTDVDGKKIAIAYVQYELDSKANILDLQHTFSDPAYRGKGLAGKVVKAAFEYAKANKLKVQPTCTYIPVFVKRNPEYKDLVAKL